MIITSCYQNLTKKTKMKGLSTTSWFIIIILSFIAWFFLTLKAFIITALLYIVLYVMEFFDEDIYDVIQGRMKITIKKFYA